MKFIHLSDLHLGKRVYEYSMLEDQEYILKMILKIVDAEKPDGILIAGDVFDKSVPPAEAVSLFDDFLVSWLRENLQYSSLQVTMILPSGLHSPPEYWMPAGFISPLCITERSNRSACRMNTAP